MDKLKKLKIRFTINDIFVYFCAFILTLTVLSLFYIYSLSPMAADLSAVLSYKTDLEKQLETKKYNLSALNENLLLTAELQKDAAPRQIAAKDETDAILYVMRMIGRSSLTEMDFKILPREHTQEERLLRPLQINVSGSYGDCMHFLYNIQHGEYYCLPDKIEMRTYDSDDNKVYMSLSIYLIVENDTVGGKSEMPVASGGSNKSDESAKALNDTVVNGAEDKSNVRNPFFYAK